MTESYVEVHVKYCSKYFDEIIGVTNHGEFVAAFVFSDKCKQVFPVKYDIVYVHYTCIFPIKSLNPNIIPYMKYGAIGLFIRDVYPFAIVDVKSTKIKKIIQNLIPTLSNNNIHDVDIELSDYSMIIKKTIYIHSEYRFMFDLIKRDRIQNAINNVQQVNIIITEIHNIQDVSNIQLHGHSEYFFEIIRLL